GIIAFFFAYSYHYLLFYAFGYLQDLHSFPTRRSSDLLPRVARLMIHTPTAISIFVCLSMVQLMAVFISMRCTLCGHFLQVAVGEIGRAVQQECRDRARMPSSA